MKTVTVHRVSPLNDLTGKVRSVRARGHWLRLHAEDGTVTFVPREHVTRVVVTKASE